MRQRGLRLVAKRVIDVVSASVALLLLAPVLAVTTLVTLVTLGRPVLFRQQRVGRAGRRFDIVKFRTMRDLRDEDGGALPDADRLTRPGRMLRALSLDELPELWNVIRGDMSLVGPRPFMAQYADLYTSEQFRRHDVYPGITGWAQINGRNTTTWEERFELDVWYVDNWSLTLDLRILSRTTTHVLHRRDISYAGHATMPLFAASAEHTPADCGPLVADAATSSQLH